MNFLSLVLLLVRAPRGAREGGGCRAWEGGFACARERDSVEDGVHRRGGFAWEGGSRRGGRLPERERESDRGFQEEMEKHLPAV